MKKLGYIDALRGLAILGVLMIHCSNYYTSDNYSGIVQAIMGNGARGVQLFYVVSAFTLFLSLSNKRNTENNSTLNFFIRRFFRIAPMYYIGIAYYLYQNGLGPGYWLGDANGITYPNILSNILFIHGFNPYFITSVVPGGWTIAVEVMFYCLVPFLFHKIKNLDGAILFFLVALLLRTTLQSILAQSHFISSEYLWKEYLFFYLPSQLPVFACGIIMFFLVTTQLDQWFVRPEYVLIITLLALMQLLTNDSLSIFAPHILFGVAFIAMGWVLSKRNYKFFVNPIFVYIGKISYSITLYILQCFTG
ncbi:hypothetical protein BH11BAC6_BH11BAC6_11890 [soil metagenome]